MTSKNLAVIFGPTLLRDKDENRDLLEMNYKIGAIEYILNHMDTLFVIETTIPKSNNNTIGTTNSAIGLEHRRMQLPALQRGEDLSSFLSNYQTNTDDNSNIQQQDVTSALPAVPPRQNAGYI